MFKIIICEDEILQKEKLKEYIYKILDESKERLDLIDYDELKKYLFNCISDIKKKAGNFIIENRDEIRRILIKDIKYIEVRKKELKIHTVDSTYSTYGSLDKIEQEFEKYNFYRCHKSYLINMEYIDSITKNSVFIGDDEINVSRYRMNELKSKFLDEIADIIS